MLTAAGSPDDRVDGLNLGADDYLAKPFHFPELVARVNALCRRAPSVPPVLRCGELTLDRPRRRASRNGQLMPLTRKELGVLDVLMSADGAVISAEQLLERVWGRIRRPVHQRRRGDRDAAAAQARPAAADRDDHRWRVPSAMRVIPAALRPWRSSIRARIVIACAALFLVLGAILIGAAYTQVGRVLVVPSGAQGETIEPGSSQINATTDASKRGGFLEFTLAGLGLGTLLAAGLEPA